MAQANLMLCLLPLVWLPRNWETKKELKLLIMCLFMFKRLS